MSDTTKDTLFPWIIRLPGAFKRKSVATAWLKEYVHPAGAFRVVRDNRDTLRSALLVAAAAMEELAKTNDIALAHDLRAAAAKARAAMGE